MRFLARRLAMLAASLLVASFVIFGAMYLAPGSALAALSGGRALPAASVAILDQRYHLNAPFLVQYGYWLDGVVHGNLGHLDHAPRERVHADRQPDLDDRRAGALREPDHLRGRHRARRHRGPAARLAGHDRAGDHRGDGGDPVVRRLDRADPAVRGQARLVPRARRRARAAGSSATCKTFTLPAVALALSSLAIVARVTRAAIREEAEREHVQTAISRGIPMRQVIQRHILRNAAIPITTVSAITVASLIAVSAVVETAFSMNGLGAYLVQAAQSKDLAVVQGISLVLVAAFVVVNLLADLLYAVLDPRVKLGARAS